LTSQRCEGIRDRESSVLTRHAATGRSDTFGSRPHGWPGREPDTFDARDALQHITFLSIGYMVARGLAKSGSRENHGN